MKRFKIVLTLTLALLACSKDSSGPDIGPPASLIVLSGDAQTGDVASILPTVLAVRVMDAQGNGVPGAVVSWSTSSGTVVGVSSASDASGTANGRWTLGTTAGAATATASVAGLPPITFSSIARAGPLNTITVTGPNTSLAPGERVQLTATARDAHSNVIAGKQYTWTSSNPSVALPDGSGSVLGSSTGTAMITAAADGRTGSITLTVAPANMTVVVQNQLLRSINVQINGSAAGTVNGASSAQFTGPRTAISVSFTLNRQTTTAGVPIGETMSGIFATVNSPAAVETFVVDNVIGSQTYFTPWIDNRTSVPFLMGVNMELTAENRCVCVVPAFTANVDIGYYRLFSNSNVRAYHETSNYTGTYVYWDGLPSLVSAGSGHALLWSTVTPGIVGGVAGMRRSTSSLPEVPDARARTADQPLDMNIAARMMNQDASAVWRQITRPPSGVVSSKPADM